MSRSRTRKDSIFRSRALLARVEVFTARKSELQSFRALVTRGQSRRETTGWISKRNRVFPERRIVEREFRRTSLNNDSVFCR